MRNLGFWLFATAALVLGSLHPEQVAAIWSATGPPLGILAFVVFMFVIGT